jgi:predicted glycosyltransferase involved in capsule biosynthesis
LEEYWKVHLHDVEIVMGTDPKSKQRWYRKNPRTFSKTTAVNRAFKKSKGDVVVILDADTYLDSNVILDVADRIRYAREAGVKLWFVPYLHLYRLTEAVTEALIETVPPEVAYLVPSPPPSSWVERPEGSSYGHKYAAMIMMMPREAFSAVHGMDERMRGWGSEDVCFMNKLDTLWGKHKNTPNQITHLWHPKAIARQWTNENGAYHEVRAWDGQTEVRPNDALAAEYRRAIGNPEAMWELAKLGKRKSWWRRLTEACCID